MAGDSVLAHDTKYVPSPSRSAPFSSRSGPSHGGGGHRLASPTFPFGDIFSPLSAWPHPTMPGKGIFPSSVPMSQRSYWGGGGHRALRSDVQGTPAPQEASWAGCPLQAQSLPGYLTEPSQTSEQNPAHLLPQATVSVSHVGLAGTSVCFYILIPVIGHLERLMTPGRIT